MQRILVTGANGFIGRHLVAVLIQAGYKVLAPVRRRDRARNIWYLPGVDVVEADIQHPAVQQQCLQSCHAVINLIGVLHGGRLAAGEPYGEAFGRLHVDLPAQLAAQAAAQGKRMVHVSALGVSNQGTLPSMYLRSKAAGEAAVQAAKGLDWRIVRPSVVFGANDHFVHLMAMLTRLFWVLPLAAPKAPIQPLWVGDLARALLACLREDTARGKTFELGGPDVYTLAQCARLIAQAQSTRCVVLPLPNALARLQASVLGVLPGKLLTHDNLDSLSLDNVTSNQLPGFAALGIQPRAFEPWLRDEAFPDHDPWITRRARAHEVMRAARVS